MARLEIAFALAALGVLPAAAADQAAPHTLPRTKIELAPSPWHRSLDLPQENGLSPEAARLLMSISLCDPGPCLGEAPKAVLVNGQWTIRFPETYRKPDSK